MHSILKRKLDSLGHKLFFPFFCRVRCEENDVTFRFGSGITLHISLNKHFSQTDRNNSSQVKRKNDFALVCASLTYSIVSTPFTVEAENIRVSNCVNLAGGVFQPVGSLQTAKDS